MKNLTKILTGISLAFLPFNSYSQNPKNTILAYVSVKDKEKETIYNLDSVKTYDVSFAVEKTNMFDLIMKGKPKGEMFGTNTKGYIIRKTEKEMRVIPTITEGGYDFSKDSKKEIEKQVREFLKDENIKVSDAVKYGSGEMFMEIVGDEK